MRASGLQTEAGSRRIGILAIQGDVDAHRTALERIGAEGVPVLREKDLADLDGLILPGGESTTIAKGLDRLALREPLRSFAASGRPVLGTCAGAILLACASRHHPVETLGLVDVVALRNDYGTQVDSFAAAADPGSDPRFEGLRCVFIRAPRLTELGSGLDVLVRVDGEPVLVRDGNRFACTFHPELTDDSRVHELLLEACRGI
jgi:5'-phosphate synthase pdxT subunit